MSSIYLVPAGGGADVQVLAVDHCRGWGESLNFLKSWGVPSRHHGCFNTKSWSSMTWMIFGYPHDFGHLHMSESFTSIFFPHVKRVHFAMSSVFKFHRFLEVHLAICLVAKTQGPGSSRCRGSRDLDTFATSAEWQVLPQQWRQQPLEAMVVKLDATYGGFLWMGGVPGGTPINGGSTNHRGFKPQHTLKH